MMAFIISLIEHGEHLSHCLNKLVWCKRFSLSLKVVHQTFGSRCELDIWIISQARACLVKFKSFKAIFELIDSFKTLHYTVHIASISKVLKPCWNNHTCLFLKSFCLLFWCHVFDKLYSFFRRLELFTFCSPHEH